MSLPAASQRTRDGSAALEFRSIFDAYDLSVWAKLRELGVPSADREDIHQEVFLVVHRNFREVERRSSVGAFVNAVCVRAASGYHRCAYRRRRKAHRDFADFDLAVEATQDQELRLEALLKNLDDAKRKIVVLHELEGNPMPEVARVLGCPVQTAYSRLRSAHRTMRTLASTEPLSFRLA